MGKGADTRRAILDQALDLASSAGLDRVTIGELAKSVGMSKSGLFAHFRSREHLEVAMLAHAVERFIAKVVVPALREPRGEPRVLALFERWMLWENREFPGGCVFQAAIADLDDRPGAARDYLVQSQRDWNDTIAMAARIAVVEGHFDSELESEQFAFEMSNIYLGYHRHARLFKDDDAERRAREAFASLLSRARP